MDRPADRSAGLSLNSREGVSAAAAGGPAVEALVAGPVSDHDRAAVHAAGGVGLGLEADLGGAEVEGDGRAGGAAAVAVGCVTVAVGGMTVGEGAVGGDDGQFLLRRRRLGGGGCRLGCVGVGGLRRLGLHGG